MVYQDAALRERIFEASRASIPGTGRVGRGGKMEMGRRRDEDG